MVVAVSEGRQLNKVIVRIFGPKLLRENRVGNVAVLGFASAVGDAEANAFGRGQLALKIAAFLA